MKVLIFMQFRDENKNTRRAISRAYYYNMKKVNNSLCILSIFIPSESKQSIAM